MPNAQELIIQSLKEKSSLKQDIYRLNLSLFEQFKIALKEIAAKLHDEIQQHDKRVLIEYSENSPFSIQIRTGGDVLVFEMHTNVFLFDSQHKIWNLSYVQEEYSRAYCGLINIYNFLSDSIQYKRVNDVGYLIGRIFINKESHFMVEGKRQMGFLYNNFSTDVISEERIREVIQSAILFCLNFDLLIPPYEAVQETTFTQITENAQSIKAITGKRLGFRFHKDEDQIS
ncbi:MAG: hypothetical protein RLZZ543_1424 [Bacteroidota bacterium]|jgi:hypothetical protein